MRETEKKNEIDKLTKKVATVLDHRKTGFGAIIIVYL